MLNIYVANLRAYNNGELIGDWIELPCDDLHVKLNNIINRGGGEKYAIHDYETDTGLTIKKYIIHDYETDTGLTIKEYMSPHMLNDFMEEYECLGDTERLAFEAFYSDVSSDIEEALDVARNGEYTYYNGCNNMKDVAEMVLKESGALNQVPDFLQGFIDTESYGRELAISGKFTEIADGYIEFHI